MSRHESSEFEIHGEISAQAFGISRRRPSDQHLGQEVAGAQRVIEALAGDRIDQSSRVARQRPVRPGQAPLAKRLQLRRRQDVAVQLPSFAEMPSSVRNCSSRWRNSGIVWRAMLPQMPTDRWSARGNDQM